MKDGKRREAARQEAETYAPRPQDTRWMYGIVAAAVALLVIIAIGAFYAIDMWGQPVLVAAILALGFAAGLLIHRLRTRRHDAAHRHEYDKAGSP